MFFSFTTCGPPFVVAIRTSIFVLPSSRGRIRRGQEIVIVPTLVVYTSSRELRVLYGDDLSLDVFACKCLVATVPFLIPHVSVSCYLHIPLYQYTWSSVFNRSQKF